MNHIFSELGDLSKVWYYIYKKEDKGGNKMVNIALIILLVAVTPTKLFLKK